jgi:putative tricarboxylic transport membrane protein
MKGKNKRSTDIILGAIIFALGIAAYYLTYIIRDVSGSGNISAATVPRLSAVILAFLGIALIVTALLRKPETEYQPSPGQETPEKKNIRQALPILYLLAAFILYAVLVIPVGFLITTPLFALSLMFLLAPAKNRKPIRLIIIAGITTGIIYVLFVYGFRVMLPSGIIGI